MSKEREMIEKLCSFQMTYSDWLLLIADAEELLAQPETKQEPVAWMWTRNYEGGGYTNKVFEFLNDAEEYAKDSKTLKSPDIIRPLYTSPPTREPFGPEERQRISKAYSTRAEQLAFEEGIIFAKNLYNIGGEPLSNEQKRLGAIAIKQREAHGFGVGNEHDH